MTSHVDTFDTRPRCIGRCGKVVTSAGMICPSCWNEEARKRDPRRPEPVKDSQQIRLELVVAAGSLAFGPESGKAAALETLSHLVTVLQHINHQPNQTPEQKADQT